MANPNDPRLRQIPEIESISLDGGSVPYQLLWEERERFRVAKVGYPDEYVSPGRHVFGIRYGIDGVLDPGTTGAEHEFAASSGDPAGAESAFYWNVIAPAWNNRIRRADISVTLPGDVPGAQCSVGYGVGAPCRNLSVSGDTVRMTAQNLAPRTSVTVRAAVDVPTPPRTEVPWTFE